MPIREIFQNQDQYATTSVPSNNTTFVSPVPEIRFVSPDTTSSSTCNDISPPPVYDDDSNTSDVDHHDSHHLGPSRPSSSSSPQQRKSSLNIFRRSRSRSSPSDEPPSPSPSPSRPRRLSQLLHIDRSSSPTSVHVPVYLPQIDDGAQDRETQWEKRATVLVRNPQFGGAGLAPGSLGSEQGSAMLASNGSKVRSRSSSRRPIGDASGDVNIQEAIRLHENGELETSTKMFGKLANPNGANNALSQVLYGLALRHGWGCPPNPNQAITYLSAAASNSASIESEALQAGVKKGGAAKGELILAIFELANCFRNGWGVDKDPVAARQYFETAANLGDTDALNDTAWCYLEGFGGRKDKVFPFFPL